MLSFVNKKTSSATLAEWNPSDWPESLAEMRTIDNLLRCSICYEYFDVAMIVPDCSHNYCSLCIRRSLSYESQCPTCKLKTNPPSLKSNRVLDELVKNFINVRTKLLELVTREQQTASEDAAHRKGGETKNKSNNSSTKRRKAHTRPENSSNSSSPDTKRQKLEDTGKAAVAKLVETAENSKVVASCSDSIPDVVVIETEDKPSRNLTPKQDPMVVDEGVSENQTSQESMDSDLAECPVCGDKIPHRKINSHLDACLTRTEKKSSLRRKRSAEAKSICSTLTKKKHLPSVETKESDAMSSDDSVSCRATQEPCSSGATSRSSTITTKGSNALIQTVQKRKPLPKLVYSVMAEKDLRQRLKEWNLSTKGDKATLVKRHQDFVMLYNAQCDAVEPMTAAQIAREVEKAEKTRAKEASSLTEASTSGLRFDKNQSEEDMDKIRQKYMGEHEDEFSKLIADIRQRQGGKKKKMATKTSECLDAKTNEPGVNLVHPESSDSGNTKTVGVEVKSNIPTNSDLCLETSPPHLDQAQNRDSTTLNKHESSSMFIPEPPSSPSLLSLPDDDEEFTPSLGLEEGDDGDDDDDVILIVRSALRRFCANPKTVNTLI